MPVNSAIRDYWVRNHATPSRCDPTPTSLAGGVLLAAGAFNFTRSFMPIWCRLCCVVVLGFGSSCAALTLMLRGTLGVVSTQFRYSWFLNFIVDIAEELNCVRRTVERKIAHIRELWSDVLNNKEMP